MNFPRAATDSVERLLALVAIAALGLVPTIAHAQSEARARAAQLYDGGVAAYLAHDYATAATRFEQANELVPSAVALAQAVRSYGLAGDFQTAGTLALHLSHQDGLAPPLRAIAQDALSNARRTAVRVEVTCLSTCALTLDGAPQDGTEFFARAGTDEVVFATFADGVTERQVARGVAGDVVILSFTHTAAEPEGGVAQVAAPADPRALEAAAYAEGENPYRISKYRFFSRPRASFFAVLVPTVLSGAMVGWSAVDTRHSRHDAAAASQGTDPVATAVAEHEHSRDVKRTKWLAVEASTFVFATAVIAAFTDWTPHGNGRSPATSGSVSVGRTGATLELRHRF